MMRVVRFGIGFRIFRGLRGRECGNVRLVRFGELRFGFERRFVHLEECSC